MPTTGREADFFDTVTQVCQEGKWHETCMAKPGACNECRRVEVSKVLPDGVPSNYDAEPGGTSEEEEKAWLRMADRSRVRVAQERRRRDGNT